MRVNPYIALVWGVAGVSTGAIFVRLADAPPLVTAAYRLGLASLILVPLAIWKAGDEIRRLNRSDIQFAALSGVFLALHFAAWITSLHYTSVANSVILVNTIPLWVGILAPFVTGERLARKTLWGVVISVVGAVIIGAGDFALEKEALFGDGLALVGGMCAAGYILLGRNLRKRCSLLAYIALCYGFAALILWVIVIICGFPITGFSHTTVAAFWGMALFSQVIGHSTYNWALGYLSAGMVAVSLLGEPVVSTILAYYLFDEGLTMFKIVGGICILSAIYLAASGEKQTL